VTSDASEENGTVALADPCGFLGGGLLIHPDLFARTYFRLFCLRYELLICAKTPHLQSIVQQVFSKKLRFFLTVKAAAGNHSPPKLASQDSASDVRAACAFSFLLKGAPYRPIYAEVASNARHWASRDPTSSGTRIITDRSHDACSSRALSSLPPVFAASV
jgi:hypothetical protein